MNIGFYFKKVDKNYEKQIRDYFTEKKLKRITHLLQHGNLELADLKVRVEYLPHHNEFFTELTLSIARHKIVAEKRSFKLLEAFEVALDHLVFQLRKIESIRHDK